MSSSGAAESLRDEENYVNAPVPISSTALWMSPSAWAPRRSFTSAARARLTAGSTPRSAAKPGDRNRIALDILKIHLFDRETETAILN
jgi:hypothetical protein